MFVYFNLVAPVFFVFSFTTEFIQINFYLENMTTIPSLWKFPFIYTYYINILFSGILQVGILWQHYHCVTEWDNPQFQAS